jgi:hypothetical protein
LTLTQRRKGAAWERWRPAGVLAMDEPAGRRHSQKNSVNLLKINYLSFFDKKDLTNGIDGFILAP